jgi:hypothetical protein
VDTKKATNAANATPIAGVLTHNATQHLAAAAMVLHLMLMMGIVTGTLLPSMHATCVKHHHQSPEHTNTRYTW